MMSNGLTLNPGGHTTYYYCIQNGNDSAILVFFKFLSDPVGIFPPPPQKKKVKVLSLC